MVVDREKDVQLLTNKLERIMDRGGDIINIMEIQRKSKRHSGLTIRGAATRSYCCPTEASRPNCDHADRGDRPTSSFDSHSR
jgi:hypothetical protein